MRSEEPSRDAGEARFGSFIRGRPFVTMRETPTKVVFRDVRVPPRVLLADPLLQVRET